jgi:serine/threonine-protein kinase
MRLVAVVIDDRYELQGTTPLGKGRFGEVWEANDQHFDKHVALKLFYPSALPADVRRALAYQEAKFLETLRAPNILPVLNADTDEARDIPYIAMELALEGSAEDQLRATPRGLVPSLACGWIRGVLVGLRGCHDARVLHGDIKPANVFLERRDSALLGDLGLARQMDATGRASPAGDLLVQPPETFTHRYADSRSDTYGVGVTLYRLLTGMWPFVDPDPARMVTLITGGRPTRVRDLAPHVPHGLALLVERAIASDPASRFPDAQSMHTAVVAQATFRRTWQPTPHVGHERCWEEVGGRAPHMVCVIRASHGENVEVVHGAAGRVRPLTRSNLGVADRRVHLRRVFDDLGC